MTITADDAEIRAWARGQGEDPPARGRIGADLRARYDAARSGGQVDPGDYDSGITEADFSDLGDDDAGRDEPPPDMTEQVPRGRRPGPGQRRKTAATTARQGAGKARGLWHRARDAGKGGKKHPWTPTATIIEHFWSQLAWAARPVPPLQKILAAQAPMAGILLQDAAKGTLIDRALLQPAARAEQRLQAANAMIGPPVWTFMIASFGGAQLGPDGKPLVDDDGMYIFDARTQPLVGGLRFSLMSWLKIADKKAEEITEAAEELTRLGDEADKLIRWILAPAVPGQRPKDVEREAAERATEFISAGKAEPPPRGRGKAPEPVFSGASQDQVTSQLEAMASSSAFRPAPATGGKT